MERPRILGGPERELVSNRPPHRRQFKLSKLKFKDLAVPFPQLVNRSASDIVTYSSKVEERRGGISTGTNIQVTAVYRSEEEKKLPIPTTNPLSPGTTLILSPILLKDDLTEVELWLPSLSDNRVIRVQVYRKPDCHCNIQVNIVPNPADNTEEEETVSPTPTQSQHPPQEEPELSQGTLPQAIYTPVIQNNNNRVIQDSSKIETQAVLPINTEAILPPTLTATLVQAPITAATQSAQTLLSTKEQFKLGYSARCDHCGILSYNFIKCVRCNKTIKSKVLIKDPYGAKGLQLYIKSNELNGLHDKAMDKSDGAPSSQVENIKFEDGNLSNGSSPRLCPNIPPEDVIIEIEKSVSSGTNSKFLFTKVFCPLLRIGDYVVNQNPGKCFEVVLSTAGVLFQIPHCNSGHLQKCVIPKNAMLKVEGYLESNSKTSHVIAFMTGPQLARWIRDQIGLPSTNVFCPVAGVKNQRNIAIQLDNKSMEPICRAIIKQLYPNMAPIEASKVNSYFCGNNGIIAKQSPKKVTQVVQTKTRAPIQPAELPLCKTIEILELFRKVISNETFEVTNADVQCLEFEQFLNDTIIYYWIMNFVNSLDESLKSRIHVFNTYFYGRLTTRQRKKSSSPWEYDSTKSQAEKRHCRVQKWTKKVDIFDKDFLIIPVNESFHWFLVIICYPGLDGPHTMSGKPAPWFKNRNIKKRNMFLPPQEEFPPEPDRDEAQSDSEENGDEDPEAQPTKQESSDSFYTEEQQQILQNDGIKQPCILLFDSLAGEPRHRIYSTLREYLKIEYKVRKKADDETLLRRFNKESIPGFQPLIPQQPNTCDCGVYVLEYVEQFFRNPVNSYALPLPSLLTWFPDSTVYAKRQEIYDHIVKLVTDKHPDRVRFIPQLEFEDNKMEVDEEEEEEEFHLALETLPPAGEMTLRKRRKLL